MLGPPPKPTRASARRGAIAAIALALLAPGCTATLSLYGVVQADEAIRRAEEHRAPELAPYEYTLAVLYFQKAREEAGYSDYRSARTLANTSADWADEAIIMIEKGHVRSAMDDLQDMPSEEEGVPSTPPPPPDQLDDNLDEEDRRQRDHGVDIDDLLEEEPEDGGP
jgi:hypothetical protein